MRFLHVQQNTAMTCACPGIVKTVLFSATVLLLIVLTALRAQAEDGGLSSGDKSFFHQVTSGKFNLIEDDFDDIRHKTTRYDFIKEKMETIRPFSRPDGPEFAIINLQWKDGSVHINDFQTVSGTAKARRGGTTGGRPARFFYRLFADTDQPLHEDRFNVPLRLHYDLLDEDTGLLTGGAIDRYETDFVIKVPLLDKAADRIIFYRQPDFTLRQSGQDQVTQDTVIGETTF